MPTCKSWMKYAWEGRHCEDPSWEADPEGLCILHSLKTDKDTLILDRALKNKLARQDFDFRGVFSPAPSPSPNKISLGQRAFKELTLRVGLTFTGPSSLVQQTFHTPNFLRPPTLPEPNLAVRFNLSELKSPAKLISMRLSLRMWAFSSRLTTPLKLPSMLSCSK